MIKSEMQKHGIQIGTKEVFEVTVCEFETEEFSCLDIKELLFIGIDEVKARACYENTYDYIKKLNDSRGGLQASGSFLGLRLTRYVLKGDEDYCPTYGDEYYGEFEESYY